MNWRRQGVSRAKHNGWQRQRNRIAPIAGSRGDKRDPASPHRAATANSAPDLCTTCLLFNESVRRYLLEPYNKFSRSDKLKRFHIDFCKQTLSRSVNLLKQRIYPVYKSWVISCNGRLSRWSASFIYGHVFLFALLPICGEWKGLL